MEKLDFKKPFILAKPRKDGKEFACADDIYKYFGKAIVFPRIIAIVHKFGADWAYWCLSEVKQSNGTLNQQAGLWVKKIYSIKIQYE